MKGYKELMDIVEGLKAQGRVCDIHVTEKFYNEYLKKFKTDKIDGYTLKIK